MAARGLVRGSCSDPSEEGGANSGGSRGGGTDRLQVDFAFSAFDVGGLEKEGGPEGDTW